jgi:ferredoxin--NADP+ reductase
VLMIGAGPAGLYAAGKLAEAGKKVVILNRDIKYGGLAEYGIYVTKHKMKEGLRKQFRKILSHPNITYYGNVMVSNNAAVKLDDLKKIGFDAVVVSAGAQGTKKVGIPGEDAKGIYHAKDLVYHYNHLPPFSEMEFPVGDKVAIIGVGNVMVDIAHWLTHLKETKEVLAIARRGPNERAYADKEMKAIAFNMDKDAVRQELERIRPVLESIGQDVDKTYDELTKDCNEPYYEKISPTRFYFKFLYSPKRVITNENNEVTGLEVEENNLVVENGKVACKGLGKTTVIELTNVVFAIGDTVDGSLGLPVNKWGEFIKNETARADDPEAHLYEVFDPEKNDVMKGYFVIGWSRKASDGLVGIAKRDGETGIKYVLKYLDSAEPSGLSVDDRLLQLKNLFNERNLNAVDKHDIEMLEVVENEEASKRALEFYKFNYNADMLRIIEQERNKVPGAV